MENISGPVATIQTLVNSHLCAGVAGSSGFWYIQLTGKAFKFVVTHTLTVKWQQQHAFIKVILKPKC